MKPERGFLKFDVRPEFIPEKLKDLYIRKAYEDLFQIICNNLNSDNETKERFHRIAITGTPGTGKSVFLFYILWRLANRETTKTVILHRNSDSGRIYVFQNDGSWMTRNFDNVDRFLSDSTTWYLTDALLSPPGPLPAVTILVSSPSRMYYSTFLKYIPIPFLHYLPTWSLEELKKTANSYSMEEKEIEKRFNMIGGVARYVLEDKRPLEPTIDDAIGSLALSKLTSIALGETSKEHEISHRIIHFKVEPPHYSKCTLIMASDYVFKEALRRFLTCHDDTVKEFIIMSEKFISLAYFRGLIFENYAHRKLSEGGEFLVRSLNDGSELMMEFSRKEIEEFWKVSACKDLNVYYKTAKKNHPCIDSLIRGQGYFQMTTSLKHPIKKLGMKTLMKVFGMNRLYFVVPSTIFKEFRKQGFEEDEEDEEDGEDRKEEEVVAQGKLTGKQHAKKKRPLDGVNDSDKDNRRRIRRVRTGRVVGEDFIGQYVINIPMDPRLDLSELKKAAEILALKETAKISPLKETVKVSPLKESTKISPLRESTKVSLSKETTKISKLKERAKVPTLKERTRVSTLKRKRS